MKMRLNPVLDQESNPQSQNCAVIIFKWIWHSCELHTLTKQVIVGRLTLVSADAGGELHFNQKALFYPVLTFINVQLSLSLIFFYVSLFLDCLS